MADQTQSKTENAEAEGEEGKAAAKPRFSRKMMIIAGVGLLVVCGGGYGGYAFLFSGHWKAEAAA